MAIPRPKILSVVTVPAAGWDLRVKISNTGTLDTDIDITVPAGDYFISWDAQSDDLLWKIADLLNNEILVTESVANAEVYVTIDSSNKVNFLFGGSHYSDSVDSESDVEIQWTEAETDADLAAALGFDSSANDTSTGVDQPSFTADWPHPYGWYAEEDGQLESILVEDINLITSPQVVSLTGQTVTQLMANRYRNELMLAWLDRDLTYSDGKGYTDASVYPYTRNKGLECWWHEARQGKRFRIYKESRTGITQFTETLQGTSFATGTITDSAKAWTVDPQTYKGMVCVIDSISGPVADKRDQRFYISSHTATVLTAPNDEPSDGTWGSISFNDGYIIDLRYSTYVVDLSRMNEYAPEEIPQIDRYNITIPLLRYVA